MGPTCFYQAYGECLVGDLYAFYAAPYPAGYIIVQYGLDRMECQLAIDAAMQADEVGAGQSAKQSGHAPLISALEVYLLRVC